MEAENIGGEDVEEEDLEEDDPNLVMSPVPDEGDDWHFREPPE